MSYVDPRHPISTRHSTEGDSNGYNTLELMSWTENRQMSRHSKEGRRPW